MLDVNYDALCGSCQRFCDIRIEALVHETCMTSFLDDPLLRNRIKDQVNIQIRGKIVKYRSERLTA